MIPWSCDATLPTPERLASLKYQRCARLYGVDYDDATELVAFLGLVPIRWSKYIFKWSERQATLARDMQREAAEDAQVARMVRENHEGVREGDGLAVAAAMRDGGWDRGKVPAFVRMDYQRLMRSGLSRGDIARQLGVSVERVKKLTGYQRPRHVAAPSRSLLIG